MLLKRDGTMTLVGVPDSPHPSPRSATSSSAAARWRRSLIGGIAETQEMLDFCHQHGLTADIEMIAMDEVNTAMTGCRRAM